MKLADINDELSHIPAEKIRNALLQTEFINTERGCYTHINCVYLSDNNLTVIREIIDDLVNHSRCCGNQL